MNRSPASEGVREGDELAAVDLGSNSFHMVVARYELGELRVIDRLRDNLRLAAGLDADGNLDPVRRDRAFAALARFGQRARNIPGERVRAVATNTVRRLRAPQAFLMTAETALGHPIGVISGREEARLIYLGVAQGNSDEGERRLVIDIGGGSTELVIGEGLQTLEAESLQMGCVATTKRFFGDGKLNAKRWREVQTALEVELQRIVRPYRARGWSRVLGSSGTIKAIGNIVRELGLSEREITRPALETVTRALLDASHIQRINLPSLSPERREVLAGGLAILCACFDQLRIERMQVSRSALREGLLYDMLRRAEHKDPRESSVAALAHRYGVDAEQAARVEATALALFDQIADQLDLASELRATLAWAARVHEIGLVISHHQHHIHGAYVVENTDMAGFSRQEQQLLATLIRAQRRSVPGSVFESLPERLTGSARGLALILRLAVLLHRSRSQEALPPLCLALQGRELSLHLPRRWLNAHPLTRADMESDRAALASLGFRLQAVLGDAREAGGPKPNRR